MHRLPALQQLWEASFTFPINTGSSWLLCCGFLFCLNYALSYNHSEGNNLWRNFSKVFEVLILSPLWQIVFPACWGLRSCSSKSEHPADLRPNPVWALQNSSSQAGGSGSCHWPQHTFVVAQKGSSSACDAFAAVVQSWVIYGWTGTDCSQLCLGEFLLWLIHQQIITPVLMWSWTRFKSSLSLLWFRIFQVFPTW